MSLGAHATIYYVATNGNDTASGTTLSAPWLTINKAAKNMQPGDTTYVRAGIYRERIQPTRSGTGDSLRITYAAYPGENPIVSGALPRTDWHWDGTNAWWIAYTNNLPAYNTK